MKIVVLGTRGFPNVQGGVEAHCEKLYPRLAKLGCDVTVLTRKPYANPAINEFQGVKLIPVECPKKKSLEAIIHSVKGVFLTKKLTPGILHIHAIGPSLVTPLGRLLGLRVVMTNHGPDYRRKKWGALGRLALRCGEILGSLFANEIICISSTIASDIKNKYGRESVIIPNGIEIPVHLNSDEILRKYSLEKGRYILAVSRLVPEKGLHGLIKAFEMVHSRNWKLVIVGRADHEDKYSLSLKDMASKNKSIILTGFLSGKSLQELYSHAGLFVLPSYYEGLPIVLLEALSYGLSCVASDIPANREVGLPDNRYFKPSDIDAMSAKIDEFLAKPLSDEEKRSQIERLKERFDWDDIAKRTLEVYRKVLT